MLTRFNTTEQKITWYYTDDVSKFDNNIDNKEHQIEGTGNTNDGWLREVRINNKGDIVPSKIVNNAAYKNSFCITTSTPTIFTNSIIGGEADMCDKIGLLYIFASFPIYDRQPYCGFVKVTILDN